MTRFFLACVFALAPLLPCAALSIGTINLEKVFEESRLVSERSAQLRSVAQEAQGKLEELTSELRNLETELQIRPSTHPRHAEFRERFEVAKLRRDLFRDRLSSDLQNREMALLRESYDDMRQLIAEFARERQLAMVFLVSEGAIEAGSVQTMRVLMGQRNVLYVDPQFDMTETFTAFANSRFRGSRDADADAGAP
ncbi:MAG: OmpH family outer membrane protein [Planctomycetota bacterium]|nr:MAG: OmpH family outer membrane protein [Planctomycetota bacterium]